MDEVRTVEVGRAVTPPGLRDSIAVALDDPAAQVAFRRGDSGWVNARGDPVSLGHAGRSMTMIERDGEPIAAIEHHGCRDDRPMTGFSSAVNGDKENERAGNTTTKSALLESERVSGSNLTLLNEPGKGPRCGPTVPAVANALPRSTKSCPRPGRVQRILLEAPSESGLKGVRQRRVPRQHDGCISARRSMVGDAPT
jgi:hypothetical protein